MIDRLSNTSANFRYFKAIIYCVIHHEVTSAVAISPQCYGEMDVEAGKLRVHRNSWTDM